ncbi:Indigoidine synthase A like protein-domain-containing protein [Coemansia spiralis]|nr:Indigoidine synthase A like protein-domain-containing protein [Coemansia spiralis]KAJ1995623.1 hypothetical protein EDC05_000861 [Coemansia umbellata]
MARGNGSIRRSKKCYSTGFASSFIRLSPKVKEALANDEPVVALESTIISHGMPYPQNVETAQAVEAIVANNGSTAATIALMDGKICVGLDEESLVRLGKSKIPAVKTSRRDIAIVLSQRILGATTVSGTMVAAHMAGIKIFATGGIGGVHRGAETTMDVSTDLTELGRTPVAVICAGAKSILDLSKTLEYLETQGVPVVAYGKTSEFPAFFSPHSGLRAPWSLQTPEQVAALIRTNVKLGLMSGQVIAVPIPSEHAKHSAIIERAIDTAVRESEEKGIRGKESTPFLLKRVVELTGGASLKANIALVKNNAQVASQIANSLNGMTKRGIHGMRACNFNASNASRKSQNDASQTKPHPLLVIGGAAIDLTSRINASARSSGTVSETSYPGTVELSVGGVGQNIARAAHLLGANPFLISAVGHDAHGQTIRVSMEELGMSTSFLQYPGEHARTAVYSAFYGPDGNLIAAVADMDINGMLSAQQIEEAFGSLAPCVVGLDGNLSVLVLSNAITLAAHHKSCVVFEPTSVPKCTGILNALSFIKRSDTMENADGLVQIITPNKLELEEMAEVAVEIELVESRPLADTVEEIAAMHYTLDPSIIRDALTLFPLFPIQIIKLGEKGVAVVSPMPTRKTKPVIRHIPANKPNLIINSNGAGDSLVGALLALLYTKQVTVSSKRHLDLEPQEIDHMATLAQKASVLSLESPLAVSDKLKLDLITTVD